MSEIYIHVGFPKCASSFLQDYLFSLSDQINFIGKNNSDFFAKFIECSDGDQDIELIREMVPRNNLPTLISIEALVGIARVGLRQRELFAKRLC